MSASTVETIPAKPTANVETQTSSKFDSGSKKLIHVLTRCFIKGRNEAIDLLEAEQAQKAGKADS